MVLPWTRNARAIETWKEELTSLETKLLAPAMKQVDANITDLSQSIQRIENRMNTGAYFAIATGVLALRLATLQSHAAKSDGDLLWILSLAALLIQSVINLGLWFSIVRKIRSDGDDFQKTTAMKRISIFLTFVSVVHNVLTIVSLSTKNPFKSRSNTMRLLVKVLGAVSNILFMGWAIHAMWTHAEPNKSSLARDFSSFVATNFTA